MSLLNFSHYSHKWIKSYQKKICHYDKQQWMERSPSLSSSVEEHILLRAETSTNCPSNSNNKFHHGKRNSSSVSLNPSINDLIDLDLISGAAYRVKSKSQQGWIALIFYAIIRTLFLPFYFKWWKDRTDSRFTLLLFFLYIMQIISVRLYYQKTSPAAYIQQQNNSGSSFILANNFVMNKSSINQSSLSSSSSSVNGSNDFNSEISPTEVLMPIAMMIVLGIIHAQIVGAKNAPLLFSSSAGSKISTSFERKSETSVLSCQSQQQTDCSSSPVSSAASSVDSSPVADVRHRVQNRLSSRYNFSDDENEDGDPKYPSLRCSKDKQKMTLLVPTVELNYQEILIISQENNNNEKKNQLGEENEKDSCSSTESMRQENRLSRMENLRKRKFSNKNISISNSEMSIKNNQTNLLNLSPNLSDHSRNYSGSCYGSSFDSEGTVSPIVPMISGDDWAEVNSDASSEEENSNKECRVKKNYFFGKSTTNSKQTIFSKTKSSKGLFKNLNQSSTLSSNTLKCSKSNGINYENKQQESNIGCSDAQNDKNSTSSTNELRVSCSLWQTNNTCQKMDLSVMDIASAIIRKIESIEPNMEYICLGFIFSITIALLPSIYRLQYLAKDVPSISTILSQTSPNISASSSSSTSDLIQIDLFSLLKLFAEETFFFKKSFKLRLIIWISMMERFVLSLMYFFLLCVAERTFKQRFLYSKYFSQITRRDRAKRSQVPHFRLHKVRNLKVWLSVRSYLRRYGPHRSVDAICSTTFIISICLLTCMSLQILKDANDTCTSRLICWEMVFWSLALGLYIMRLMILGSRVNQKYRSNLSVLITEQINLYLQLERKPHKKEALMLANHVLKLAVDLLKELESPYKISGFSANPYLYNITKVVVLSAFSAVLTEMLGFKLKLYKISLFSNSR